MANRPVIQVTEEVELALPDGSTYRIRPGPYGKGISIVQGSVKASSSGKRGRKPRTGTVKLRERLERDAEKGNLRDAAAYVKWMMKQDPDVGLSTARQIVYRERRRVAAGQ